MSYIVKVFQYKKGTTQRYKIVDDVIIEGHYLGKNKTCLTMMVKTKIPDRVLSFISTWINSPLGLTDANVSSISERCKQFVNSGVNSILFLEVYTKKKNRIEIFIEKR